MSTMWDSMLSTSRTVRRGDGLRCLSTAYQDGETALNHQDVLYELELFCEVSGTRFLHVDIAETRRWEDHATSQVPYLTDCGIGFTTNCEDLCKSFEDWSADHVFDNVLSWDFSTWLAEWSVDTLR